MVYIIISSVWSLWIWEIWEGGCGADGLLLFDWNRKYVLADGGFGASGTLTFGSGSGRDSNVVEDAAD